MVPARSVSSRSSTLAREGSGWWSTLAMSPAISRQKTSILVSTIVTRSLSGSMTSSISLWKVDETISSMAFLLLFAHNW